MSHENSRPHRSELFEQNGQLLETLSGVFFDIATSNKSYDELSEQYDATGQSGGNANILQNSALIVDKKYYWIVTVEDKQWGTLGSAREVFVERLTPAVDGRGNFANYYKFRLSSLDPCVTEYYAKTNENKHVETGTAMLDTPGTIADAFRPFISVDDNGLVTTDFTLVPQKDAEKILRKHNAFMRTELKQAGPADMLVDIRAKQDPMMQELGKSARNLGRTIFRAIGKKPKIKH